MAILPYLASESVTAAQLHDATSKFTDMLFSTPDAVPVETKWLWRGMMGSAPAISYRFVVERQADISALYAMGGKGYPLRYIIGLDEQVFNGRVLVNIARTNFTNLSVLEIEGGGHSVFHQNTQEVIGSITEFVNNNRWTGC